MNQLVVYSCNEESLSLIDEGTLVRFEEWWKILLIIGKIRGQLVGLWAMHLLLVWTWRKHNLWILNASSSWYHTRAWLSRHVTHVYLFCSHLASMNNLQELLIQNQHCASLWDSSDIDGLQIWFHMRQYENLRSNQNLKKSQVKRIRFFPFRYLITIVKKDIYFKDSFTSWNIYLTLCSVAHPFELLSSIS